MYDFYKEATIEITLESLSNMMTNQAIDMGIIDDRYFITVKSLQNEGKKKNPTFVAECDVFKYMEN